MENFESFLKPIQEVSWGIPTVVGLLLTGIYFTLKLNNLKISNLKLAFKYIFDEDKSEKGNVSNFASLCTVLSATLGTGNIVGTAVAVTIAGPGVIFWLWISSLLCFSIKYCEGFLAIKYRTIAANGKISGGPMYYIEKGLKNKWLARVYALFGVLVAIIGIGTLAQSKSIVTAVGSFGIQPIIATILLSILVIAVTIGGIDRISSIAEKVVPFMTFFYIGGAILVLIMKIDLIPHAFYMIFYGAFFPESFLGEGVTIITAINLGISRGIYSHESGLGSSAIAVATARTNSPYKQGIISMAGAFLTVVVCTMTGLVLIVTCEDTAIFTAARAFEGISITSCAFGTGLKMMELGKHIVNISIIFFAFTTIIGWNYYGEKCIQYLGGDKTIIPYKFLFIIFVAIGPFLKINVAFVIADIVIAWMMIPNVISIIKLRKVIIADQMPRKFS